MPDGSPLNEPHYALPSSFFECLVKDIPADTWIRLLNADLNLKAAILEGFTVPANKLRRLVRQPHIVKRLERFIRSEDALLEEVLQIWGQEQLSTVAFLEMLDRDFLFDNWQSLKNFIGPERFFAGISVLGRLMDSEFQNRIDEEFWKRQIDMELIGPMIPFWDLWNSLIRQFPQANSWLRDAGLVPAAEPESSQEEEGKRTRREQLHRIEERSSTLQMNDWSEQTGLSFAPFAVRNAGQNFVMKLALNRNRSTNIFFHFGEFALLGLSLKTNFEYAVSFGGGFASTGVKDLPTINGVPSNTVISGPIAGIGLCWRKSAPRKSRGLTAASAISRCICISPIE